MLNKNFSNRPTSLDQPFNKLFYRHRDNLKLCERIFAEKRQGQEHP